MKDYRLNLIDGIQPFDKSMPPSPLPSKRSLKSKRVGRFFFRLIIILLVIIIFFYTNTIFVSDGLINGVGRLSFWEGLARLALGKDKMLKGELSDRVNVLLLGMGGAGHEGPYLTDTIILVSLKPSTNDVALFSIPRDLYVPTSAFGWQKINAVNSLGMTRSHDGATLTSQTITEIFNVPVDYWIRLDFSAFKDFINWLHGIEINVERSFVDTQYPASNYQFQTISFEAGPQLMDGERALEFARSRHGNNNEDSDFARMKRQQKILMAIKNKLQEKSSMLSPTSLWELYNIFNKQVAANLDFSEIVRLTKIFNQLDENKIKTYTFEAGPSGPLYSEIAADGAYILRPKGGNFEPLAKIMQNAFSNSANLLATQTQEQTTAPPEQKTKLIILNGTKISGLAQQNQAELEKLNYQVVKIGNAPTQDYPKTIIYTVNSAAPNLSQLEQTLGAISTPLPQNLQYLLTDQADYLIILGGNNRH